MLLLLLKLTLAPALVASASLLGRRFGPKVTGWMVGFPIVAGPILLFFAIEQGASFASKAAMQMLSGLLSLCLFVLSYNWTAIRCRWPVSLAIGWAAFLLGTACIQFIPFGLLTAWAGALIGLWVTYRLLPKLSENTPQIVPPKYDIPMRMGATCLIVLLLTGFAKGLGPTLSGLLTPFPVASAVLGVFAHMQQGASAVSGVFRGLLIALVSVTFFCAALSIALVFIPIWLAFVAALLVTGVAQFVTLKVVRGR